MKARTKRNNTEAKPRIEIYDTTLRDGTQGEGINLTVPDKMLIATALDKFGVGFIEGGWPGSNPGDIAFFKEAQLHRWKNARIAAFGSTRRKNVKVEADQQVKLLLEAQTPVVTIFGKTSLLHVHKVLNTTPDENAAMISDTIRFLKENGKYVIYDAEHAFDGYKNDSVYAQHTWQEAQKAGADMIVLCDTNGGTLPGEITEIVTAARRNLTVRVGIHTHDDIGFASANALSAVEAGATHVQGTVNGYGERTGNCNLSSIIPTLQLKARKQCVPDKSIPRLVELSRFVAEVANMQPDPRQPWVGSSAFAHKGGMHVNAVQKVSQSFEHASPEAVGNNRRILVGGLSGRSNIVMKAEELGFKIGNDNPALGTILATIKELEHQGFEFEAAEGSLALLIGRILKPYTDPFDVEGFHVSNRSDHGKSICQASVKVRVGDKLEHTVDDGDGPVNALDGALRKALCGFFPPLRRVRLTDYKVRVLQNGGQGTGTAVKTRVLTRFSHGRKEWGTVGVHDNIIEASLTALKEGMAFALKGR